jgi:hypothetical protein
MNVPGTREDERRHRQIHDWEKSAPQHTTALMRRLYP